MKRFGYFLAVLFLTTAIYAQTSADTTANELTDSIVKSYEKTPKQMREEALLEKLDADQLLQLEKLRLEQEKFADMPLPAWAIVMIATAPFIMVLLIVFFSIRGRKEREKARYELYLKSIESGQPLPEKFFETAEKKQSNLKRGAIWLAVGLGVIIFGILDSDTDILGSGAIPALVGIAFLIVYFIEKPKNNSSESVEE